MIHQTATAFLNLCSRPKHVAWEWVLRSASRSSTVTAVRSGCPLVLPGALFFTLNYPSAAPSVSSTIQNQTLQPRSARENHRQPYSYRTVSWRANCGNRCGTDLRHLPASTSAGEAPYLGVRTRSRMDLPRLATVGRNGDPFGGRDVARSRRSNRGASGRSTGPCLSRKI